MKILLSIWFSCIAFSSIAQKINIYAKWAAKIDNEVLLILDITKTNAMQVSRVKLLGCNDYKIDSFGFKRVFNTTFIDLDSSLIWWSGALAPLHPKIGIQLRLGMIEIIEFNNRGVPQKIKLSGDLPDLSIYLDEEDFIIFNRINTTYDDEFG